MGRDENSQREPLQAVLIADSFTSTFRPITLSSSTPRVLCPLNNVTLLDYSIEWLAGAGVEELLVLCVSGHAAVSAHIANRNSQTTTSTGMKVDCISDPNCSNAGDALRELDRRGLIRSDPFLLLHGGDVVTNVDIAPAIELHKARKKKDPSAMMTVLLKPIMNSSSSFQSPTRSTLEDLVVGIDVSKNDRNRILLFDSHPRRHSVSIPCSFFSSHSNITVRSDLLDTGIDICSPDVLARFSDEFDYRHVRKQFVANSVAEEDVGLQNKIYAHLLPSHEYAARVQDLRTYHVISQDLLRRWVYPVVPDNLPSGYERKFRYVLNRNYTYKEVKASMRRGKKGTMIARQSTIGSGTLIGAHAQIKEGCKVHKTVIGHNCTIQQNSKISNSHLWNNVYVHAGSTISYSILCDNVIIRQNAVIGKGCVIGAGCIIGEGVILPDFTRVTLEEENDDDDDDFDDFSSSSSNSSSSESNNGSEVEYGVDGNNEIANAVKTDHNVVGPDGLGRVWQIASTEFTDDDPDADSDYEFDDKSDLEDNDNDSLNDVESFSNVYDIATAKQRIQSQSIGYNIHTLYKKRLLNQEKDGLDDDDDYVSDEHDDDSQYLNMVQETNRNVILPRGDNATNVVSSNFDDSNYNFNQEGLMITGRSKGVNVVKEMKAICMDYNSNTPVQNLMIELNGFKFSQNATFSDCVTGAILAIMDRLGLEANVTTPVMLCSKLKKELVHWMPLFTKMCISIEEEISILIALENAAVGGGDVGNVLSKAPSFRFLLQTLYDMDIVSEDAITEWSQKRIEDFKTEDSDKKALFFQEATQTFLQWLEEDSESDSDSDDNGESDSD